MRKTIVHILRNPLSLGTSILLIAIVLLAISTVMGKMQSGILVDDKGLDNAEESKRTSEGIEGWEYYVHPEYKFSLYVPELLIKKEYDDPGDYLFFVRFEESRISTKKGLAVGVSERSLLEEEDHTRKLIEEKPLQVTPRREELKLIGYDAIRLDYEGLEGLEPRTIILVDNKEYVYSISTHPEQIDRVLSGFVFID